MEYMAFGKNCFFQTLRHYKNYIFEIFCLQQATLLDLFKKINASKMIIFKFKK